MSLSKKKCDHCHLPIDFGDEEIVATINDQTLSFCCHGCKSVCESIYNAGMDGFYRRTTEGETLQPPPEIDPQLDVYDLDEVQQEFVTRYDDESGEIREIHLLIEGIHCAACIWLIERRLANELGIVQANVNLSAKKLHLKWQDDKIKLSQILSYLGQIGYAGVPFDPEMAEGQLKKQNRQLLFRLGFAGFAAMNLMWISIALYAGADEGEFKHLFYWLGLGLATPTLLYSGYPFYRGAITGLMNRHLTMDLPVAIGATITYFYSCYVVIADVEIAHVYFDTVVNFIFVILTGRYLEAMSKRLAVQSSQRLLDLQPKIATLLIQDEMKIVPVSTLKQDDRVLVKAGEKIPVDGIIVEGESIIDESMLTGEFVPVNKFIGDQVSAGTTNKDGVLSIQVNQTLKDTALGKIIHLVDEAQATKAPIQCTADKIIPWFVSITLLLATITFIYWLSDGIERALMAATSVLIITCPCAFGLATPMAIAVATGVGARMGILVKHGAVLEILSSVKHFVFDKTGTLTQGKMLVSHFFSIDANFQTINKIALNEEFSHQLNEVEKEIISLSGLLESHSEHSIARSIVNFSYQYGLKSKHNKLTKINTIPGSGIRALLADKQLMIGKLSWLQEHIMKTMDTEQKQLFKHLVEQLESQMLDYQRSGSTIVYSWLEDSGLLLFVISDQLRSDTIQVIERMHQHGFELTLLSGDKQVAADFMAQQLNIDEVIAEVLPEEKDQLIQKKQRSGHLIAMVGDGINDAPALVRADVGIAMGSGTDVSIDSADVILVNGELAKIPLAAELSQVTLRSIKQNITISIVYNVIMVPLAMAAMITPLVAAISMPLSSLLVIANAARIRWKFKNR